MNRNRAQLLGMLYVLKPDVQDEALKARIEQTLRDNGVKSVEHLQHMYCGALVVASK